MHAPSIDIRRFEQPDQQLDFANHGRIDIVTLHDGTVGMHAVFEPGWIWEVDEKPLLGNPESCPMTHIGYCIRGELAVRMQDTGTETRIRTGDFFEIPAHHAAYVPGDSACECILFAPSRAS